MPDEISDDKIVQLDPSPNDVKPTTESSTVDVKKEESKDFAELAMEAFAAKNKATESSTEVKEDSQEKAPEGDIIKDNKIAEETKQEVQPKPDDKKEEDFTSLPFHKHERFQALVKEKNELKTSVEAAKPSIERLTAIDAFCAQNRISFDQFKQALEIQALINTSPEAALDRLQPLISQLQEFKGQVLPEDLKKEVDDGSLPLARAQEIAKLRKQTQFKEQQSQQTARDTQSERLMTALSSFEDSVRRTDPDYENKKQLVLDRFVALSAREPWQTPEQAVSLAKRAYTEVTAKLSAFVPKPKPTKNPPVNGHSAAAKPQFTTWDQADEFAASVLSSRRR